MILKPTLLALTCTLLAGTLRARSNPILSRNEVRTELQNYRIVQAELRDNRYIVPNETWLKDQLIPFYIAYAEQNLSPALNNEKMSDGLCKVFQSIMYQANIRGGGTRKGDVPVGVMMTRAKGQKELRYRVIIRTESGWSVIDPNDGAMTSLRNFKTTNDIFRVAI
ncbi:MAG: hypothetical protein AAF212_11485 [Verrucomicrobiota bacterium]